MFQLFLIYLKYIVYYTKRAKDKYPSLTFLILPFGRRVSRFGVIAPEIRRYQMNEITFFIPTYSVYLRFVFVNNILDIH